jgi:topoisomerase-4 subunit A
MEEINEPTFEGQHLVPVSGMYQQWFLDYASYVILERAVPYLEDGLKPVQRRILHSLWELEDGRYNKAANVIGHCMKYHPHGDASIGEAMVGLGQKELLLDCQGNWGNIFTGDSAAAPRYIEARLSKFALEVAFNPNITEWQSSYDGRNKEPLALPIKFPLLLAQGVEGIAVGLACKILPHNFNELLDACIDVMRGKKVNLIPDFPTGGLMDAGNYNDGLRGGKIRVRARISINDKKQLVITEIPFGTNTTSLIDSILAANDKEKIKVKKVEDNTAEHVEIVVHLPPGISPDKTVDALYAFTDCEVSISPNACIIEHEKPRFAGVSEILKASALHTRELLRLELEHQKNQLEEAYFFSSLEKIFIRQEMYIQFKEYSDKPALFEYLFEQFRPHRKKLLREITQEDLEKLTQIPMIRITRFDSDKADEKMRSLDEQIKEKAHHLANLTEFAIEYFKNLKKKYGKGRERKTEVRPFDTIVASNVIMATEKLYVNRAEGFAGTSLKKDELVCDCSPLDDIIVIREDGTMTISKVSEKAFVGKDILHIGVFQRNDERTVYNLIYQDGPRGNVMKKRFAVSGITRDKVYDLTRGNKGSKVLYLTCNPNGEAEVVTIQLKPMPNVKKLQFDVDFAELAVKSRSSQGNIVTQYPVKKIVLKERGLSTLGARMIWYDDSVQRLNVDQRGTYLGEFSADDKILALSQQGTYRLHTFDLSNHFDEDLVLIEKFNPERPITAVYFDGERKEFFVKRFLAEPSDKKVLFISEIPGSYLEIATTQQDPVVDLEFAKQKGKAADPESIRLAEIIAVKGLKARGNRLSAYKVKAVNLRPQPEGQSELFYEKEGNPVELDLTRIRAIQANLDDMEQQMSLDF